MKRASIIKMLCVVLGAVVLLVLGAMADRWIVAEGGDPISGNVTMIVLVAAVALIASVVVTDRNRAAGTAPAEARTQALTFAPKAGVGQVVIFRNDRMGAKIGAGVVVDGSLYTELTSPAFTVVDVAPGRHRVAVALQARQAEQDVEIGAGDVVALHVRMRMGLTETIPSLESVALDDARRLIGNAPMVLPLAGPA